VGSETLRDRTAIVGIGATEFGKGAPESEAALACGAVKAALDDAGLTPDDVDGLSSYTYETTSEFELARNLGFGDLTWFDQIGYGGGAGCATVGHAAAAVTAGLASVVVAWRSRKRSARASRLWAATPNAVEGYEQWGRPWGLGRPVDEAAMLGRRYLHQFGYDRDVFGEIAVAFREHANRNPAAVMHDKPLSIEQYFDARWISEPLCLFDNCLETDGACAVVVVSAERARDLRQRPVYVHAAAQGLPREMQPMSNFHNDDPLRGPSWPAARRLWADAEFGPGDLDTAQIYDAFTPYVVLSLEGYGICERGEAGMFVRSGALRVDGGKLPTNTSGGSLSEAYIHGFNLIIEGVRQLRGTSPAQVDEAETCLVTSGESVPSSAVLLRN